MCHESSGLGLTESIGIGKATVKIDDFAHADSIFVIGQNPGTCHPRMLTELQKAARNGCKIVSVNPLPETGHDPLQEPARAAVACWARGTPIACLFLPVRINGDVALLKGIMKEMLEADRAAGGQVLAHDFIQHHTEGFEALVRDLDATAVGADRAGAAASPRELIDEAAEIAHRVAADDLLLGDGHHPAQERRRQRADHRQLRAPARADRAARRRRSARCAATATCKATARSASGRR